MNLEEWLKINKINASTFARKFKITPSCVRNSVSGEANISPQVAEKIEEVTGGEVSRAEAIWKEFNMGGKFEDKLFIPNLDRSDKNLKKLTYAEFGLYTISLRKDVTSAKEFYKELLDLDVNVNIIINSLILKGFLFEKENV